MKINDKEWVWIFYKDEHYKTVIDECTTLVLAKHLTYNIYNIFNEQLRNYVMNKFLV